MTREIPLSKGKVAIVDDEDYDFLSQFSWYALFTKHLWYACGTLGGQGKKRISMMHRVILNPPQELLVDHINGNGLDNRRSNLRTVTHSQNLRNSASRTGTSKYKGVCWVTKRQKWLAYIGIGTSKNLFLGVYLSEEEAARAYDAAAVKMRGEYARINFPADREP